MSDLIARAQAHAAAAGRIGANETRDIVQELVAALGAIRPEAVVKAEALREAADVEADWTSKAWRHQEVETVVKLRKGLKARADRIERGQS